MKRFHLTSLAGAAILWAGFANAQTPSPTSNERSSYIFRFSPPLSELMIESMNFQEQKPLDLGACSTTELSEGPLVCAENCENVPVCLLVFNGPAGLTSDDVLQKAEEIPASGSGASSRVDAINSAK